MVKDKIPAQGACLLRQREAGVTDTATVIIVQISVRHDVNLETPICEPRAHSFCKVHISL